MKKRTTKRKLIFVISMAFLLLYIISLWITFLVGKMVREERKEVLNIGLLRSMDNIKDIYDTAYDISVEMAANKNLKKENAIADMQGEIACVEVLGSYLNLNYNILIDYHTGFVYSASGKTGWERYLKYSIGSTAVFKALSEEDHMLWVTDDTSSNGQLFICFPLVYGKEGSNDGISIFGVTEKELEKCFMPILDTDEIYLQIRLSENQSVWFKGGNLQIEEVIWDEQMSEEAFLEKVSKDYFIIEKSDVNSGITVEAYYDIEEVYMAMVRKIMRNIMILSIWFLVLFLVIFFFIGYILYPLAKIRDSAQKMNLVGTEGYSNELDYLWNVIVTINLEREQFNRQLENSRMIVKEHLSKMLFYGHLQSRNVDDIESFCGISSFRSHLAVGCLKVKSNRKNVSDWVEKYCEDRFMFVEYKGEESLWYFTEQFAEADASGLLRLERGRNLLMDLEKETGVEGVLSFGNVVENKACIMESFYGAKWEIERLKQGAVTKENVFVDTKNLFAISKEGKIFENAIIYLHEAQDIGEAERIFKLLYGINEFVHHNGEQKLEVRHELLSHFYESMGGKFPEETVQVRNVVRQDKKPLTDNFEQIIEYLEENFTDYNLSLENVAQYCNVTVSYLSRIFKVKTGKKYIDYVSELRLNKAAELLEEKEYSVADLCTMVGYSDVGNFRKKFKNKYGVSVSEYRVHVINKTEKNES